MTSKNYEVKLDNVRLSFENVFVPKAFKEGQIPRWEATFLLDPSDKEHAKTIKEIESLRKQALIAKFGGEANIPKGVKNCYGFADKEGKEYTGWEGMFYIGSAAPSMRKGKPVKPPIVLDRQLRTLTVEDGKPYSGCYVNAKISLWVQNNEFGKRVNANLLVVQFFKDGDAFGSRPVDVEEDFEVYKDEESSFDEKWDE